MRPSFRSRPPPPTSETEMSNYYTTDQKKALEKLEAVKSMVTDCELHGSPCPLMLSQLYELKVFSEKLTNLTSQMIDATKDRIAA